jgi:ferritin
LLDALNKQVNAELYSSYLYLAMSAYLESQNLKGMARWMRLQAQEEDMHAMKIFDFIHERGGRVTWTAIEGPPVEWDSPRAVFEAGLEHEKKVTGLINDLVDLSIAEKDHAANTFLQWFVTEQVEEEASFREILDKFGIGSGHPGFLFHLDMELGKRPAVSYEAAAAG